MIHLFSHVADVIIRTNGGNLNVNASLDTVKHHGKPVNLHIKAIKNSSWHEFGYINFAQVDSGRFVVENYVNVGAAYVESSTATLEGTVAIKFVNLKQVFTLRCAPFSLSRIWGTSHFKEPFLFI